MSPHTHTHRRLRQDCTVDPLSTTDASAAYHNFKELSWRRVTPVGSWGWRWEGLGGPGKNSRPTGDRKQETGNRGSGSGGFLPAVSCCPVSCFLFPVSGLLSLRR